MICPHCKNNTACEMPMSGLVCDTVGCDAYKAPSKPSSSVHLGDVVKITLGGKTLDTKGSALLSLGPGMQPYSHGTARNWPSMAEFHEPVVRSILDDLPPGPGAHDRAFDELLNSEPGVVPCIHFIEQHYADTRKYRIHWSDGSFTFFWKAV